MDKAFDMFVYLYPINVKAAEPIGPKFFVGHHVTTGKIRFRWSLIFEFKVIMEKTQQ